MVNLDLSHDQNGIPLSFAKVDVFSEDYDIEKFSENVHVNLYKWMPKSPLPYEEFA